MQLAMRRSSRTTTARPRTSCGSRPIDRPEIADDEVLVRVHAAGVDRGVWHLMAGMPGPPVAGFGLRAPKSRVRGLEFAGRGRGDRRLGHERGAG